LASHLPGASTVWKLLTNLGRIKVKKIIIVAGVAVFLIVAVSLAVFGAPSKGTTPAASTDHVVQTASQPADSGVVTCQEMANRANTPGPKPKLSFADVRAKFQSSQDAEIRTAGVKLVDTLEKADKIVKEDGPPSDSLGAIMAMKVAWMDLQVACGKHGVEVPDLKA